MPAGACAADSGGLQVGGSCAMPLAAIKSRSRKALEQTSDRLDRTTLNLNQPCLATSLLIPTTLAR